MGVVAYKSNHISTKRMVSQSELSLSPDSWRYLASFRHLIFMTSFFENMY